MPSDTDGVGEVGGNRRWEDVYRSVLRDVRLGGVSADQTKGETHEILGYQFVIPNGRDRVLSDHPKFDLCAGVGHWLWIMAGRQDYESIRYYNPGAGKFSADKFKMHGAYGPRLFGIGVFDQVDRQIQMIKERGDTRRAVATVYAPEFDTFRKKVGDAEDEVPCTVALQFRPREGKLFTIAMMRSQNAFGLLPLDVFVFTLIQEYVAVEVNREVGAYHHFSGSFHYYDRDVDQMVPYAEATADPLPLMPSMPEGEQRAYLTKLLVAEEAIRNDSLRLMNKKAKLVATKYLDEAEELPPFWRLVEHALIAMAGSKQKDPELLSRVLDVAHPSLQPSIRKKLQAVQKANSLESYDFKVPSSSSEQPGNIG